jgi:hypothetical protein
MIQAAHWAGKRIAPASGGAPVADALEFGWRGALQPAGSGVP